LLVLFSSIVILISAEINDSFVEVRKSELGVNAQSGLIIA